jgi:autotransporter-associated beta strand protein
LTGNATLRSSGSIWNVYSNITDNGVGYGLTVDGGGVSLRGNNTYYGPTITTNGANLYVSANNALGTTNGNTIVAAGGVLVLDTDYTTPETMNLNGGTLRSSASGGVSWSGDIILGANSYIRRKNLGAAITINGVISGDYGLTIGGSETGEVVFTAINTYTGPTIVQTGTLTLNGALPNSPVTATTGTLGGTGFINTATLNGGTLSPGSGVGNVGTITAGNLTLTNTVALAFDLQSPGASDYVNVTNQLSWTGLMQTNWFVLSAPSGLATGEYTLLHSTLLSGQLGEGTNFTAIGGNVGYDGYLWLSADNKDVMLTVVPEPGAATLVGMGLVAMLLVCRWRRP